MAPKKRRTTRTVPESSKKGRALKAARIVAGLSQKEAAEAVERDFGTVSRWERGTQQIGEAEEAQLMALYAERSAKNETAGTSPGTIRPADTRRSLGAEDARSTFNYSLLLRLPPRVHERVYGYLTSMRDAKLSDEDFDLGARVMIDPLFSKENKRDARPRTDEELITDVDAAWAYVRILMRDYTL